MKIAMLHASLPSDWRPKEGGVTYFVDSLADQLAKRGHEITMFSFDPPPPGALYKTRVLSQAHDWHSVKLLRYYGVPVRYAGLSFKDFDLVHAHGDDWLLHTGRVPHVRTFYGSAMAEAQHGTSRRRRLNQRLIYQTERLAAYRADATVVISTDTLRYFSAATALIPCGVDTARFRPQAVTKSLYPAILFIGALEGRKRGNWLVELFRTRIQPVLPEAQLWLVGEKAVEGAAGIHNFGKVSADRLVELCQQAWVFCLPSTYEGFGIPYIEAMAAGTPVVASPNAGSREVLANGKYGLLCEDDRLGQALLDLLQQAHQREKWAALGLQRAADYDWSNIVAAYERLYRQLLDQA